MVTPPAISQYRPFAVTGDFEAIRAFLSEPRCARRMGHDATSPVTLLDVERTSQEIVYVAVGNPCWEALFLLIPQGDSAEVHFCFSPSAWGHTMPLAAAFLAWVWKHTGYLRLTGPVPSYNRLALRLALSAGFRPLKTQPAPITKHGQPVSLIWTEILRPPL